MTSEVISFSFVVDIYRADNGKFEYGVLQEIETEDDDDLQLLERGEADTLLEAAEMASKSIKTLFSV